MTPGHPLVVNASVAVKWYVPEPDSQRAFTILSSGSRLLAPDLLISEVGNIIWKKVRRGELTIVDAQAIVTALTTACPLELYPRTDLLSAALDIAATYQRTVYDSLYVALAHEHGCQFVTADERLANALAGTPSASHILMLSQL
jgi:predicted nucleic acid-binding protein